MIERYIHSKSFLNIKEVLEFFIKSTGIQDNTISKDNLDYLIEIKARRNILIHNNLIVNKQYIETAGPKKEILDIGERLFIDKTYLIKTLNILENILNEIEKNLKSKYSAFTKLKAVEEIFSYIFDTPLLQFNEVFEVDKEKDQILKMKKPENFNSLASSEKVYFNLWYSFYQGKRMDFSADELYRLTDNYKVTLLLTYKNLIKPAPKKL